MILAILLWSSSFVAGKYVLAEGIDPVLMTVIRYLIASLLWFPAFLKIFPSFLKSSAYGKKKIILISFLTIPVTILLEFMGLQYTSVSSGVIILGTIPLFINVIGVFFWKEKLVVSNFLASLSGLTGVILTAWSPDDPLNIWGAFLIFAATVVTAFWVRMSRDILRKTKPEEYSALTTVFGTILLFPFLIFSPVLVSPSSAQWTRQSIGALLFLGIGCSFAAPLFWNKGLKNIESNRGALFLLLEPLFGVGLGILLLGETLRFRTLVGGLFILVPLLIKNFRFLLKKQAPLSS